MSLSEVVRIPGLSSLSRLTEWIDGRIEWWLTRHDSGNALARYPHSEVTWKSSQRTIWVATHGSEFLGVVEEDNGTYVANDTTRGTYNTYRTLAEAMSAFERPDDVAPATYFPFAS